MNEKNRNLSEAADAMKSVPDWYRLRLKYYLAIICVMFFIVGFIVGRLWVHYA